MGTSTGDGEQGLSCPGGASAHLVPLLGVDQMSALSHHRGLFHEQKETVSEVRG